ncbi:dienelactone hydrolase family protein [Acidithiobacillus sp.]|uniref:dienelactone hydrolase family protein n=1 Tax=Acidithiobacillus sp. TaxID=1872118 RepID=UPI0025BE6650|nr:dienelactone hydrolase family protein [Acidithiobacillus sp.]
MSAIQSQWLDLNPSLRAWYAHPTSPGPHPAVLVFIEAFGVNEHFRELAERLAKAGYCAVVPDIYHGKVYDYTDFDGAIGHLRTLKDDQVMTEAQTAVASILQRPEVRGPRVGVLGFCMGGRYAFLANAELGERVAATVAFYGGGIAPDKDPAGRPPLLGHVDKMQAPLLLLYGAEDQSIAPEEHGRIATALSTARKRYTLTVFPGAPHGFFSDRRDSYRAEPAREAWEMTLNHLQRGLGVRA